MAAGLKTQSEFAGVLDPAFDVLTRPIVEGSAIKVGELVSADELVLYMPQTGNGWLDAALRNPHTMRKWLSEPLAEGAPLEEMRRHIRDLAYVLALRRFANERNILSQQSTYKASEVQQAREILARIFPIDMSSGLMEP